MTGNSEHNKTNNIYDMCGNDMEWTMEAGTDGSRFCRGGYCYINGDEDPVHIRIGYSPNITNSAFRIALYIK